MKHGFLSVALFVLIAAIVQTAFAGVYEDAGIDGVLWLEVDQNPDGSWGASEHVRSLYTAEAVSAQRSFHELTPSYYWGIAWLENHEASNTDYKARQIQALHAHGDNVQNYLDQVYASMRISFSAQSGWGLSSFYNMNPLDSAISIRMLRQMDWPEYSDVLAYVKDTQNSDGGWSVGEQSGSDPLTSARVVQVLCLYQDLDPTLDTFIQNGESFLNANVDTTSPVLLRSQAIEALHPNNRYPAKVQDLVDTLVSDQDVNGHWDNDAYVTASAVSALSVYLGNDPDAKAALCDIPDTAFRCGINTSLGKNEGDALTEGEMESLAVLDAAGLGISNLAGIGNAINLTQTDLRNNQITSLEPFHEFANPEDMDVLLDGNPLSDQEDFDGDGVSDLAELNAGTNPLDASSTPSSVPAVPAVDFFGWLFAAAALATLGLKQQWRRSNETKRQCGMDDGGGVFNCRPFDNRRPHGVCGVGK